MANTPDSDGTLPVDPKSDPADGDNREAVDVEEQRSRLWDECAGIANLDNIVHALGRDLAIRGFAGETVIPEIVYLVGTSRLLPEPASLVVKGESSAGKNTAVQAGLRYLPDSAVVVRTDTSDKALYYTEEPLKHGILVLYEADVLAEGGRAHIVRNLLSEGHLSYEVTDFESRRTIRIEKEGPMGLITTTTRLRLDAELETRMWSVTVPDDPEQTRAVMLAVADGFAGAVSPPPLDPGWIALQDWLDLSDRRVVVPYGRPLVSLVSPVALRMRRDLPRLLSLVSAHALLHQATRSRDVEGRIVATIDDYRGVHRLVAPIVAEAVEYSVPPEIQETVDAVDEILNDAPRAPGVTQDDLAQKLGVHRTTILRRVRAAVDSDFLKVLDPRGRPRRYALGHRAAFVEELLPQPEVLEHLVRAASQS